MEKTENDSEDSFPWLDARVTHFDSSASLALARSASLAFRAAATSRVTRSDEVAREMEEDPYVPDDPTDVDAAVFSNQASCNNFAADGRSLSFGFSNSVMKTTDAGEMKSGT